jgi:phospho-N-acetylmuramoyl-pentapeptide-transferase
MISLQIVVDSSNIEQAFMLGFLSFIVSMVLTPLYTTAAFAGQWWKKIRTHSIGGNKATVFHKLHAAKHERNIPTMAGIIFVLATLIVTVAGNLSRSETWLPLAAMVGAGSIGLTEVHMPFIGTWHLSWLIIPLFILVVFSTGVAVNISDGLDGLAGGLSATAFGAYTVIAIIEKKYGIAGFCMTVVGALLSYTWFNIYPARFFMGDVGSFALGTALGVVAMLTDTVFLLPVIGLVFVVEVASVIINRTSRKLRNGKKVFLSSPIHHHFEAIGWPETKVTMRFWVIGQVAAFVGVILFVLGGPQ